MAKYLIVGDVDHIQDYVFGSSRLRAIRGASALLDVTAEKVKDIFSNPGLDVLRWRGGQIVVVLQDGTETQADDKCAIMERAFRDDSAGEATITTAYVPYQDGDFEKAIKKAFRKVKLEKEGRQSFGLDGEALLTSSYDRRCDLLPSQSATVRIPLAERDEPEFRYLSPTALKRWQEGKKMPLSDWELGIKLEELKNEFPSEEIPIGKMSHKPEDLWESESQGQYLAFVMADGNCFGQLLENIENEKEYKCFSSELHDITLTAVALAIRDGKIRTYKRNNEDILPFIPIILGGDDSSMLVRAENAADFAYYLCKSFYDLSMDGKRCPTVRKVIARFRQKDTVSGKQLFPGDDESKWSLSLSVGFALAKKKFPISLLRRFVSELRSSAKTRWREDSDAVRHGGTIDFASITTATVQPLADLRRHYEFLENPGNLLEDWTYLTARPYTVQEFEILLKLAKELNKNVPRSKRKYLYKEFFNGWAASKAAYSFVMSKTNNKRDIISTLKELGCDQMKLRPFREMSNPRGLITPLLDALELSELGGEG